MSTPSSNHPRPGLGLGRVERAIVFERVVGGIERLGSLARVWRLRLLYPGVEVGRGTSVGPGVTIRPAPGSTIRLRGVRVGRGAHLETAAGAVMDLAGSSVGAGAVVVARERVEMRTGSVVAEMAVVRDADHVLRRVELSDGLYRTAPVVIGRGACVLARATIGAGVTVGDRAIVEAGAVVTSDVPPAAVVGGVPARALGHRDGDLTPLPPASPSALPALPSPLPPSALPPPRRDPDPGPAILRN